MSRCWWLNLPFRAISLIISGYCDSSETHKLCFEQITKIGLIVSNLVTIVLEVTGTPGPQIHQATINLSKLAFSLLTL